MRGASYALALLVTLVTLALGTAAQPCEPVCAGSSDLATTGTSQADDDGLDPGWISLGTMASVIVVALVTVIARRRGSA